MSAEAKRSWTRATACGNLRGVRVTGLNHVSISSIDVEASVRFYVEVLGLEPEGLRATLYLRDRS
jgi:hypothetical protein